jgi:uncharacterized protein (UPF0332 family)
MNFEDLLTQGSLIQEENIGWDQVERLIKRARQDLLTGQDLIKKDEGQAVTVIYNAFFHAANALLRSKGLRPGRFRQHLAVLECVKRILGRKADPFVGQIKNLLDKRNKFEYQALYIGSQSELKESLSIIKEFVGLAENHLDRQNPQQKLMRDKKIDHH